MPRLQMLSQAKYIEEVKKEGTKRKGEENTRIKKKDKKTGEKRRGGGEGEDEGRGRR